MPRLFPPPKMEQLMAAVNRLSLIAALASLGLALSACPPPVVNPPGDGGGPTEDCFEDIDCPDTTLFYCNTTTSKCEPACFRACEALTPRDRSGRSGASSGIR